MQQCCTWLLLFFAVLCLQSGDMPGLVRRLLLLEAVQQPVAWSWLAPGLCNAWQQQQHLDLARAAFGSHSNSSESNDACAVCSAWMPQLLTALLQPNVRFRLDDCASRKVVDDLVERELESNAASSQRKQNGLAPDSAAAAAAADLDAAAGRLSHSSYALACLRDVSCRYSLTSWVLAWHAALLQQAGDYSSAASR
jgi:hypothetical protein